MRVGSEVPELLNDPVDDGSDDDVEVTKEAKYYE